MNAYSRPAWSKIAEFSILSKLKPYIPDGW